MQAKQLLVLAAVAVLAIGVATYLQSPGNRQTANETSLLLPALNENINAITQVRLKKAGDETIATLKHGEQGWRLAERNDYRADAAKIRKLLLQLAEARVLEQKTSNPELYSKLGVEDITSNDTVGFQVEIEGLESTLNIILGETADTLVATYARLAGEEPSVLISGHIEPDSETRNWLDAELLDIAAARIQSVRVTRPDGDDIEASKPGRGGGMEVHNLPQDRELKSATAAATLASVLSDFELDDVMPDSSLDLESGDWIASEFETFDGLVLGVRAVKSDEKYYLTMGAAFDEQQARPYYQPTEDTPEMPGEETSGGDESLAASAEGNAPGGQEIDASAFDDVKLEAEKLQSAFEGWAFEIPQYKYDNLTKPLSSLLKEEEE